MSGGTVLFLVVVALILFAGPREELKYRAAFLVIFLTVILFLVWWKAPTRLEADIRGLFR